MHKMRISLALIIFTLITLQIRPVWGADNGGADNGQKLLLEKSFPTESGERLKFNGYAGNVKICCWHKNEVKIKIYGSSEAGKYLNFVVSSDELGIRIAALKKAGIENAMNLSLRYEISVPSDYYVKVSTGGNVIIEDQNGPVEISKNK